MPTPIKIVLLTLVLVALAIASFWPAYFYVTRNGFRKADFISGWIIHAGNNARNRRADMPYSGPIYPDMSDNELGSRVLHSVCASGAPCLDRSQYRLRMRSGDRAKETPIITFGVNLSRPWRRAYVPGDRYVCRVLNPYWFSCMSGSFRFTEYRFIADGPYTPIQMWEEKGEASAR